MRKRGNKFEGFVARDRNGDVFLWRREPIKNEEKGAWEHKSQWAAMRYLTEDDLEPGLDPRWEDEKPIHVRLVYFEHDTQPYMDFLENNRKVKHNGIQTTRIPKEGD